MSADPVPGVSPSRSRAFEPSVPVFLNRAGPLREQPPTCRAGLRRPGPAPGCSPGTVAEDLGVVVI